VLQGTKATIRTFKQSNLRLQYVHPTLMLQGVSPQQTSEDNRGGPNPNITK